MAPSGSNPVQTNVLFAWELGAGLGHATRMRPLVERAMAAGLSVKCLAIRRHDAAALLPCPVEEAPWLRAPKHSSMPYVGHLGDTLAALGWADAGHLREPVGRWRAALERERPGVMVMDSAPVALLASQGLAMKRVWLADGWNTPPDVSPLPDMAERVMGATRTGADTEPAVVAAVNAVLVDQGEPAIDRLFSLFERADLSAMLTLEALDPHGPRPGVEYRGVWGVQPAPPPSWPVSALGDDAPGVFAYLKPFPHRAAALKLLAGSGLPTLALAQQATDAERVAARGGAVRLLDGPVDWCAAADRLAMVVCHASPAMMGLALRRGVPVVGVPLSLEQAALARRASETGAVVEADARDAESIRRAMHRVLTDASVADAALRFSEREPSRDPDDEAQRLADEIIALASI